MIGRAEISILSPVLPVETMNKSMMKKEISRGLRAAGFERKGASDWYLHGPESLAVVNLQKYRFSDIWFVNIGIWIKDLGDKCYPKFSECHLNIRAPSLWPDQRVEFEELFDLNEERFPDDKWAEQQEIFARDYLAPMCMELMDTATLRERIELLKRTGLFMGVAIKWLRNGSRLANGDQMV